jgi:hypothetical protein
MIKTLSDNLALHPIDFSHETGKDISHIKGFAMTDKLSGTLIKATVAFDSRTFKADQVVYLRPEVRNSHALKRVLTVGDKSFVLVSESEVVLAEGF